MKKLLLLILVMVTAFSTVVLAGVLGSKHDMRLTAGITGTNQICVFCHHPHRGDVLPWTQGTLLWNYNSSNYTYRTTYVSDAMPANTVSMDATTIWTNGGPAVYSMYCLGCHDGDTGADTLLQNPGDATVDFTKPGALSGIGSAMQADTPTRAVASNYVLNAEHPINFTVFPADDLGIVTPWEVIQLSGTNDTAFPDSPAYVGVAGNAFGPSAKVIIGAVYNSDTYPLFAGTLQCTSCHDPHNGASAAGTGVGFIRNAGLTKNTLMNSSICRDCHSNK